MMLRLMGAAGLVGFGLLLGKSMRQPLPAAPAPAKPLPKVRDAGPEAMNCAPKRWDMVDQQADESFPASDPPGNY